MEILDDEDGEDSGDEGIGSAFLEHERNSPKFVASVDSAEGFRRHQAPSHVQFALKAGRKLGKCSKIRSLETVCRKCNRMHINLRNETVTTVVPLSVVRGDIILNRGSGSTREGRMTIV